MKLVQTSAPNKKPDNFRLGGLIDIKRDFVEQKKKNLNRPNFKFVIDKRKSAASVLFAAPVDISRESVFLREKKTSKGKAKMIENINWKQNRCDVARNFITYRKD